LFDFIIKFRLGKEIIVADILSRLNDEYGTNTNQYDDYHHQLVASVEMQNNTLTNDIDKISKLNVFEYLRTCDNCQKIKRAQNKNLA
jgi:hypothetical protein